MGILLPNFNDRLYKEKESNETELVGVAITYLVRREFFAVGYYNLFDSLTFLKKGMVFFLVFQNFP